LRPHWAMTDPDPQESFIMAKFGNFRFCMGLDGTYRESLLTVEKKPDFTQVAKIANFGYSFKVKEKQKGQKWPI